jgi:hypothetical protein
MNHTRDIISMMSVVRLLEEGRGSDNSYFFGLFFCGAFNPPPYLRLLFSPIPAEVPESAHSQQLLCCSLCAYFLGNEVTSGNLR